MKYSANTLIISTRGDVNNPDKRRVGRGADVLEYQQLRNAPNILFEDLGPTTMGSTHPLDFQKGFIRLSNHLIKTFDDGQRTYVHELGNYLSTKIVKWHLGYGSLDYFGDPNGIKLAPNVKADTDCCGVGKMQVLTFVRDLGQQRSLMQCFLSLNFSRAVKATRLSQSG